MATDALVKVVHKGHLLSPQTFSFSVWLATALTPSESDLAGFLNDLLTPLGTWRSATGGLKDILSSGDAFTEIRAYAYAPGSATPSAAASVSSTLGGAVARTLPYQCALVHSLRSSTPGRSGRARMYIPLGVETGMSGGQMTAAAASNAASTCATYLTALNNINIGVVPGTVCVASPLASVPAPQIVEVVVDTVVDTQRRRRDKVGAAGTAGHGTVTP